MASCAHLWDKVHDLKPTLIMILVQTILTAVTIGYKLAMNDGMPPPILISYRFMFGGAFIVPIAFFAERKKRPKLTWKIIFYGFLCGLFGGSLGQNLYLESLALTSATFATAMMNLVPAITFIIAICLRMEKLGWKTWAGKAKVLGTLMGIGGAMLLTFYKGPELKLWNTNLNLLEITTTHHRAPSPAPAHQGGGNLGLGAVLAVAGCICYSLWLIIQAKAAKLYPCPYTITGMTMVWSSVQSVFYAVCKDRDWSGWRMGFDIRLLATAAGGILGSGLMFTLMAWCVRMRGPLFASVFNPLLLVLVAIVGSLTLDEKLHLGMVLGAVLIVLGLYVVLWGKSKELKRISQLVPVPESEQVQTQEVHVGMPPPLPPASRNGSSRSGSRGKKSPPVDGERAGNPEVLDGFYVYH